MAHDCPSCSTRFYTTEEVAQAEGSSVAAIRQRAKARRLGWLIDGKVRLFTRADVEALAAPIQRGRPRIELR